MKTVILIYTTDPWHILQTKDLVAVATTEAQRDRLVRKYIREILSEIEGRPSRALVAEAIDQIRTIGQTQCLDEQYGVEILTEVIDVNDIIN